MSEPTQRTPDPRQRARPIRRRRRRDRHYGNHDDSDERTCLVFSPLAWLKLQMFLHAGDTEVGGFGVSSEHDPLYVQDFETVRQAATPVTVQFDDAAVADYFDRCVDAGLSPARFARVWVHTHPGDSPEPSGTDEATFARVFGGCDWAVMFIASRTGRTYARLSFSAGPGGSMLLPVAVDWAGWPQTLLERCDELAGLFLWWAAEFDDNVHPVPPTLSLAAAAAAAGDDELYPRLADGGWWDPEGEDALYGWGEVRDEAAGEVPESTGRPAEVEQ